MSSIIADIEQLFDSSGRQAYLGEPVSIAEHMLQTAHLAELDGASPSLVVAALLHDIGHLVHTMNEDSAEHGVDTQHEDTGAAWLSTAFPLDVTEPIRLHVAAKRYLCATDAGYLTVLSPASQLSLRLQGGPFTDEEATTFAAQRHAGDAVRVRRWDDMGKIAGQRTPALDHFRSTIGRCLHPAAHRE